jgi:uncharacterized FlaG/YvyC family protein
MLDSITNNTKNNFIETTKITKNFDQENKNNIVKESINFLNDIPGNKLKFGFNYEFNEPLVIVYDENENVLREFPSEEFFKRLEYFRDYILPGLFMDKKI